MPACQAVLFDVDGVLIDSYAAHFHSWQALATENGRTCTEAEFVAGFGRTSREVILEQWSDDDLTDARIQQLDDRKEELFREIVSRDFPAMDGARDLIDTLHAAGIRIALGSSGPPENVNLVIEQLGIGNVVEVAITGTDVTRGKPDPQVFQLAAERLNVEPKTCVVVEDAPAGIQAAHAAGMKCVGLASTGRTPAELSAADLVVDSLNQLEPVTFHELATSSGSSTT